MGVVIVSVFIFSVILAVGMYFYKNIISGDISSFQLQLASSAETIDKKTINELVVFNEKLRQVQSLVWKHKVISGFMSSLSSSTVSSIAFSEFNYSNITSENPKITMKGRAPSYGSIALQEKVFSQNKYWKDVVFSELSLSEEGLVTFAVTVEVDPQIVVYDPIIENGQTADDTLSDDLQKEIEELEGLENIDLDNL